MKIRLALGALALAVLAACGGGGNVETPPAPSTNETKRIVVFGDSLSDGGTYMRANQQILAANVNPALVAAPVGKFTNSPGAIWVEALGTALNVAVVNERYEYGAASPLAATNGANSAAGATNYAQGGSRVAGFPGVGCTPLVNNQCTGQAAVPVTVQVDRALAKGPFTASDLVFLWAGANDVFFNTSVANAELVATGTALGRPLTAAETQGIVGKYVIEMEKAAIDLVTQIKRVQAAGAQRVVVMTIPNAAQSPFGVVSGPAAQGLITALANGFNNSLRNELSLKDLGVLLFDAGALASSYYTKPAENGFTNVAIPVCNVPTALGSSSSFCFTGGPFINPVPAATSMFADGVHPSLASHAKFGTAMLEALRQRGWVR